MNRVPPTFKGFTLNPFQQKSVQAIQEGKNLLVSAPTGAGKTLVAEYAIDLAMKNGRRCIYTSPIKALSNQKYRDFRDDPAVDVGIMTGDVTINPQGSLLIMTTEILRNTIFDDPSRLKGVDYVIFDEIHYMDDFERGTVWEESIIFLPPEIRLIGLSATISNIQQFGDWIRSLRTFPLEIITSIQRPVPLQHYLYYPRLGVFPPRDLSKARNQAGRSSRERRPVRDSDALLNFIESKKNLPVLYFCFSRKDCEVLARKNQRRKLLTPEETKRMEELFGKICESFELETAKDMDALRRLAMNGVGYHHAGMLPIHKEVVERLFTSGLLKLLFATETFAMGINMPAKSVIFDSLWKYDGVGFRYLRTRDYMQMAGRAGRQGIDKVGLVYSVLESRDLVRAPMDRILSEKVEPISSKFNLSYSTLINLYGHLKDQIFEAWEKSFNYFQAKEKSPKQIEKNRARQHALIQAKLDLLKEFGYIDEEGVLDRGRIAAQINGYELQITEFLFQGLLEDLDPHQINCVFAATVYEPRRGDLMEQPDPRILGDFAKIIKKIIRRIQTREISLGISDPTRIPALELSEITHSWSKGAEFELILKMSNLAPGDLVRTFRLTNQLLRQLRRAITKENPLYDKLGECIRHLNRDVVDARRQLELG